MSVVLVAILFRLLLKRWPVSAFVVTAGSMQALVCVTTTLQVSRDRPDVPRGLFEAVPQTASFPSGPLVVAFLLIPPVVVAWFRMYRGMHFPADLVGSLVDSGWWVWVSTRLLLVARLGLQLSDWFDTSIRDHSVRQPTRQESRA